MGSEFSKYLWARLSTLWRWSQDRSEERRMARERVRFWNELRAGEGEAEARSRPRTENSEEASLNLDPAKKG